MFNSRGRHALQDHSGSEQHKRTAAGLKGRTPQQPNMARVGDANQNLDLVEGGGNRQEVGDGGEREEVRDGMEREAGGGEGTSAPLAPVRRSVPTVKSLADRVATAEVVWSFKMVESNLLYNSLEDIVAVLQKMDPDSLVLRNLHMKRTKSMYILCYGLHPYYLDQLIRRIQKSPGYTLGTDSSTFKLHGLSKVVEGRGEK